MRFILSMCLAFSSIATAKPVLMVGDSVFAMSGGVAEYLSGTGLEVNDESVIAAKIPEIALQYQSYDQRPDVVVLNGGGNDILLDHRRDCIRQNSKCKSAVLGAIRQVKSLMNLMASDGVETIIYVGLYHFRFFNRGLNPSVDDGMDQLMGLCDSIPACDFVDSRDFIVGGDLRWDDLHPSASGSRKIGQAISMLVP